MKPSEEMKKHLLRTGLSPRELELEGDIVLHIHNTTYAHLLKIWAIHKDARWEYFLHMEYEGLREVKELRKAQRLLRGDWRNAYREHQKDLEQKRKQSNF